MHDQTAELKPDTFIAVCPSRAVLARMGEKWTLMILVSMADGPVRFGALRRRIEGISQKMLTQVLRNLERDGLLERRHHDERLPRVEYTLTALGRDLLPLAQRLKAWAEEHLHEIERNNARYDEQLARG